LIALQEQTKPHQTIINPTQLEVKSIDNSIDIWH
jgi:hypothetical protein